MLKGDNACHPSLQIPLFPASYQAFHFCKRQNSGWGAWELSYFLSELIWPSPEMKWVLHSRKYSVGAHPFRFMAVTQDILHASLRGKWRNFTCLCLEYLLVQPGTQQLTGILEHFVNPALGTRVCDVKLKWSIRLHKLHALPSLKARVVRV